MIEIYHNHLYIWDKVSNRKQIFIMLMVTVFIVIGGGAGWWLRKNKPVQEVKSSAAEIGSGQTIIVNTGEERLEKTVNMDGRTALEATREATGGQIETSGEGSGAFVTAVSGRKAETDKKEFWEMIVNGQAAMVGAGSYVLKPGDTIEWRINTY